MPDSIITQAKPWTPTAFINQVVETARPALDDEGNITSRGALAKALLPLFEDFTIADAVPLIAMLRLAGEIAAEKSDGCDRSSVLYSVGILLEDFASNAHAAGPTCVSARAAMLQYAAQDDAWSLGNGNEVAATRHLLDDTKRLRANDFWGDTFGSPFSPGRSPAMWLYNVVSDAEGREAASGVAPAKLLQVEE